MTMTPQVPQRLFIRRDGVVRGPFTPAQLEKLRTAGELRDGTEFSSDKHTWRKEETHRPEPANSSPQAPAKPVSKEEPAGSRSPAEPPAFPVKVPLTVLPPDRPAGNGELPDPEWDALDLLGDAAAMLWDSSSFPLRFRGRGCKAACLGALFAVLLALVLCGTALGLFAARYRTEPLRLTAVTLGALGGALLFFYLIFAVVRLCRPEEARLLPELDAVTAAFGMFQLAGLLTLILALAFLRNPVLYRMPPWGDKLLAVLAAAGAVCCIGQTLNGFRLHLTNHLSVPERWAMAIGIGSLWLALTVTGYVFLPCIMF